MRFDFPTVMVALVILSGAVWAVDALFFAPRRRRREVEHTPTIVEYARSFFPIFLLVFVLRSFIIEPFRIPSNSMMPTLLTGDFILVNKFGYGIRMPVIDKKLIPIGAPERGDVIVFRYPEDPSTPFIKRVVGIPGDQIAYYNKTLYVNGEPAPQEILGSYVGRGSGIGMTGASERTEQLDDARHEILVQEGYPSVTVDTVIPPGHYFVLGDNRDNSKDSRYWGTVPDELLIGKAFTIWMNWDWGHGIDWGRIGKSIQ